GDNPYESSDYGRIVNSFHFSRLKKFLENGTIIIGGETSLESLYIAPTILDNVSLNDAVMQEEIFGPILPVLSYENLEETVAYIRSQPKPLAIYVFSNDRIKQNQFLDQTSSGGVCINDTVMQISIPDLPFGGVGNSGMGNYHGKSSFDTFTHKKSVLKKGLWLDLGWRYAPYTVNKLNQIKKIING
ncbi:MAG: aldehyde dehydrogenase family protein, partial [Candidatus Atelocyanobacterium sp. ALOHA_A2.5_9]|nr:aldehyde dehydrogenase family protein [Candidatus Atelocyanobacterium sp. ALOHA_A2.5_9]